MRQRGPSARLKQTSHSPMLLLDLADRVGQGVGVLRVGAQDVEGQALGGALPDAGQLAELGDQALDGRRVQGVAGR